jgi:hypothetical protein
MALNLYRRHHRVKGKCVAGHKPDSRNYEPDELRRGWRKCHCPVYICGTLGGQFKRRNSNHTKWEEAKAVAAVLETANSWAGRPMIHPCEPPPDVETSRIRIVDALAIFLSLREGEKLAQATLRKYRTFTKQLMEFADSRGYVMLDQLKSADVDAFYSGLKLGIRSKAKRLSALRAFFRFCVNREFLLKSPVSSDLKPPQGSSRVANKIPFTDGELERIINACDVLHEVKWSNGQREGVWAKTQRTSSGRSPIPVCAFPMSRYSISTDCMVTRCICGQRRTAAMSSLIFRIGFVTD